MSKTASAHLVPSNSVRARLMASIERLLAVTARIAAGNGGLPRFGL
jgi:hypothetical protein